MARLAHLVGRLHQTRETLRPNSGTLRSQAHLSRHTLSSRAPQLSEKSTMAWCSFGIGKGGGRLIGLRSATGRPGVPEGVRSAGRPVLSGLWHDNRPPAMFELMVHCLAGSTGDAWRREVLTNGRSVRGGFATSAGAAGCSGPLLPGLGAGVGSVSIAAQTATFYAAGCLAIIHFAD